MGTGASVQWSGQSLYLCRSLLSLNGKVPEHKEIDDKVNAWREEWEGKLGDDAYYPLKQ